MGPATEMLRQWTACVKGDLLPGLHGHLCKALAALSLASHVTTSGTLSAQGRNGSASTAAPNFPALTASTNVMFATDSTRRSVNGEYCPYSPRPS